MSNLRKRYDSEGVCTHNPLEGMQALTAVLHSNVQSSLPSSTLIPDCGITDTEFTARCAMYSHYADFSQRAYNERMSREFAKSKCTDRSLRHYNYGCTPFLACEPGNRDNLPLQDPSNAIGSGRRRKQCRIRDHADATSGEG